MHVCSVSFIYLVCDSHALSLISPVAISWCMILIPRLNTSKLLWLSLIKSISCLSSKMHISWPKLANEPMLQPLKHSVINFVSCNLCLGNLRLWGVCDLLEGLMSSGDDQISYLSAQKYVRTLISIKQRVMLWSVLSSILFFFCAKNILIISYRA